MLTLNQRIERAPERGHALTFVVGGTPVEVPYAQLLEEAKGFAANLQHRGVGEGDHVAILGPTSRELVTAIEAVWLAGATVVVLPLPMRMASIEEFVDQTRRRILHADVALVLVDPELAAFVEQNVIEKFDVYLGGDLLTLAYASEHLDVEGLPVIAAALRASL